MLKFVVSLRFKHVRKTLFASTCLDKRVKKISNFKLTKTLI